MVIFSIMSKRRRQETPFEELENLPSTSRLQVGPQDIEEEEILREFLPERRTVKVARSKGKEKAGAPRRKSSKKRRVGLKAGLLKKLRSERKSLSARLRQVERDIASLTCKPLTRIKKE